MAIEASFTIERADFPLSGVFEQLAGATIELDRVVPTSEAVIPYVWIYAENADEIGTDLRGDVGVDDVAVIDDVADQTLVRIDWNLDHESVLTAIVDTDVTLLSGVGTPDRWTFEVRASEQNAISAFQTYCRERDIPVNLTQIRALSPVASEREHDLTDGQRRALVLAYSTGYFDSPREATQDDLADQLDITRQAVSSRLQRGMRRLVASALVSSRE